MKITVGKKGYNDITLSGAELLAENKDGTKRLYVAKWANIWRYVVDFKDQPNFITGDYFATKQKAINNLHDNVCLADLTVSDIKIKTDLYHITQDQKVAINTAIRLLNTSNSDHVDQCLYYLKQLKNNL